MPRGKLRASPGVVKNNTPYSSPGRWVDMDHVRFVGGLPQKIGGWSKLIDDQLEGAPRGEYAWRALDAVRYLAVGTTTRLYLVEEDTLANITPYQPLQTGTLTNAIDTTNGSSSVTINHTAHGLSVGEFVYLEADTVVGGLRIRDNYEVQSVSTNSYTITAASDASSTATGGGGSIEYEYDRQRLSGPFTMTSGSPVVSVAFTSHGLTEAQVVIFDGASAVGGLTIDGEYTITTVVDANTFTVTAASNASSNASGGGNVDVWAELVPGNVASTVSLGFGSGPYGEDTYGTPRTGTGITIESRSWSFGSYGEWLCANPRGQRVYQWQPDWTADIRARRWPGLPDSVLFTFIAETRHVVMLGVDGDAMRLAWTDDDDPYETTPSVTNDANSRRLNVGSQLIAGVKLRQNSAALWSDTACFIMQYTGTDFVFDTRVIADGAGLCGPLAMTSTDGKAFWFSGVQFYGLDGSVQMIPSDDVREWFLDNADQSAFTKLVCGTVKEFGEVWFFYQASDGSDIDSYLTYSARGQGWTVGTLDRACWVDQSVWTKPVAVSPDGYIYQHETGVDAVDEAIDSFVELAPMEIDASNSIMEFQGFVPDFKDLAGNVDMYVSLRDEPQGDVAMEGPFQMNSTTTSYDKRMSGRLAGFKIESNQVGGYWRLGAVQLQDVERLGER